MVKLKLLFSWRHILKIQGEKISLVAQSPYIYNDTIMANIFLGRQVTPFEKDRAWNLLKLFDLDFLGNSKDEVLNLLVGEDGKNLSGRTGETLDIN